MRCKKAKTLKLPVFIRRCGHLSQHMRLLYLCSLSLLMLSTACNKSSADQLKSELQTISSWAATAHMVGKAWTSGNVPTTYAKRTLQTTDQSLQEEMKTLLKSTDISPDQRAKILQQLQSLKQTVGQMQVAVEHSDRFMMGQQIQQIATEEQMIRTFAKGGGTP